MFADVPQSSYTKHFQKRAGEYPMSDFVLIEVAGIHLELYKEELLPKRGTRSNEK